MAKASTSRSRPRTGTARRIASDRARSRILATSSRRWRRFRHAPARMSSPIRSSIRAPAIRWRPLLTENVHPQILVGYGDPAVLKTDDGYSSSRRPTTRPTPSRSSTRTTSSIGSTRASSFPQGEEPGWAAKGRNVADFWAPEMARVGDEYWLGFTARQARTRSPSASPEAPARSARGSTTASRWSPASRSTPPASARPGKPQMSGGVIDSHIFVDADGDALSVLEGRHEQHLAAPAGGAAAPAAGADRAAVRRASRTAAPPPSPRRSSPWANAQRPMEPLLPDAAADRGRARQLGAGPRGAGRMRPRAARSSRR